MYDWPETKSALQRFWNRVVAELSARGIDAPHQLTSTSQPFAHWQSPELLISQTCGWPYANRLRDLVIPFARFDYGLLDCPPGFYRSVFVGQSAEDRVWITSPERLSECPAVAINGDDSQSGFHVFAEISGKPAQDTISPQKRIISGAHRASIKTVASGEARLAAIDGVAFELARLFEPNALRQISVLGYSTPKPGLPLITSLQNAGIASELYDAVTIALDNTDEETREILRIRDVLPASEADYRVFLNSQNG